MEFDVMELREQRREGAKLKRQTNTKEQTVKYFQAVSIIKKFLSDIMVPAVMVEGKQSYLDFDAYYLDNFGVDMSAMLDTAWMADKPNHQSEIKAAMTDIHKLVKSSIPELVKKAFGDIFLGMGEIAVTDSWNQFNFISIEIRIDWKE